MQNRPQRFCRLCRKAYWRARPEHRFCSAECARRSRLEEEMARAERLAGKYDEVIYVR